MAVAAAGQFQALGYSRQSTESLYRYLSASHHLHAGRAFVWMAKEQLAVQEMGQAEAFCGVSCEFGSQQCVTLLLWIKMRNLVCEGQKI